MVRLVDGVPRTKAPLLGRSSLPGCLPTRLPQGLLSEAFGSWSKPIVIHDVLFVDPVRPRASVRPTLPLPSSSASSRHNARRVRKLLEPVGTETDWGRAPEASRAERGESFFLLVEHGFVHWIVEKDPSWLQFNMFPQEEA